MGYNSNIGWTNHTFNPWIGCHKVSRACKFCYAEELMDKRFGRVEWGSHGTRMRTSDANWMKPIHWNSQAKEATRRDRVFCASLADVFEDHPTINPQWREQLWSLIGQTPHLDWLLLTKRPENVVRYWPEQWQKTGCPPNIWLGATMENQDEYIKRLLPLMVVKETFDISNIFASMEPLVAPITYCGGLDWVIVGGESGKHPDIAQMELNWVADIVEDCDTYNTPVFVKQLGTKLAKKLKIKGKGEDMSEWSTAFPNIAKQELPKQKYIVAQ